MRKRTIVKIDKKEYTVKELTVREIISLLTENKLFDESDSDPGDDVEETAGSKFSRLLGITGYIRQMIEVSFDGLDVEELVDMAPSEIAELFAAFKEVNSHFFVIAQTMELGDQLVMVGRELLKEFSTQAIVLSKQAMETFGTTDTAS